MRLAHFSDIHVTIPPVLDSTLFGKRLLGALNYWVGGRARRFAGVEARIEALLRDVETQRVDHAICTGDLTAMSYAEEFERCADLFGERLSKPEQWTVLPGNHDRYTEDAVTSGRFEARFAGVSTELGAYPMRKMVGDGICIIGLDGARPTGVEATGLVGTEQRARLVQALESSRDDFVIVALHYGLRLDDGKRDRRTHGLADDLELMELLEDPASPCQMVVHGHVHHDHEWTQGHVRYFGAGSATDLGHRCGYNVYEIDPKTKAVQRERRVYNASTGAYEGL